MGLINLFKRKKDRVAGQTDLSQMPATHQQAEDKQLQDQKKRLRNKVKEWRG